MSSTTSSTTTSVLHNFQYYKQYFCQPSLNVEKREYLSQLGAGCLQQPSFPVQICLFVFYPDIMWGNLHFSLSVVT
ncbi:hypothetical protein DUNSADRAFT_16974 [Dunaliella salina]|uniref:Uncharacterized protein n=1 Tax=Dunaliella salina TaxID=3046 RepID=A0ABQ7G2M3_DUNSA|nr:hypothetical protein DUNSADRAFT_16974 [Dunaliella salina]|eukprot:KAF5828855.1 hypothetical protein DUNSADRAFT_16974 [Dunaliella salina]